MSDTLQPVRRRINGWYVDDLQKAMSDSTNDKLIFWAKDAGRDVNNVFEVASMPRWDKPYRSNGKGMQDEVKLFSSEESVLVYPVASLTDIYEDHPTLADLYYGHASLEQFLAMSLAMSLVRGTVQVGDQGNTLRELLAIYKRTESLHLLFDAFNRCDAAERFFCSTLHDEQRDQYMIVYQLILLGFMSDTLSESNASNEYCALGKKVLDKLDRCFRDEWAYAKELYNDYFADVWNRNGGKAPADVTPAEVNRLLGLASTQCRKNGEPAMPGDISIISSVRFFMMTRKCPFGDFVQGNSALCNDTLSAFINTAIFEYMNYRRSQVLSHADWRAIPTDTVDSKLASLGTVFLNSSSISRELVPTRDNPVTAPFAAQAVLASHGITMSSVVAQGDTGYAAFVTERAFKAGVGTSVKFAAGDRWEDVKKHTADLLQECTVDAAYYLTVIDLLSSLVSQRAGAEGVGLVDLRDFIGVNSDELVNALSVQKENARLKAECEQLAKDLEKAKAEAADIQTAAQIKADAALAAYKVEKESQMNLKLQKKDERIARLEARVDEISRSVLRLDDGAGESEPEVLVDDGVPDSRRELTEEELDAIEEALDGLKVYIFGGRTDWRKKVIATFPYIPTIPSDSYMKYTDALCNADIVVVNTYCCSHKAFDMVADIAKKAKAEIIYIDRERSADSIGFRIMEHLGIKAKQPVGK